MIKSPFIVEQDLLSPLLCEDIVDLLAFGIPDVDKDDNPLKTIRHNESIEEVVYERFDEMIPIIESHYDIKYKGMDKMQFEFYPQGFLGEEAHSENSNFYRGKWIRTKDFDFVAIIWLSTYSESTAGLGEFDIYGGKLEFPQYDFSFNPEQGTMVIFPAVPNFINAISPVEVNNLYQIRIKITADKPYLHDPKKFPGSYIEWFESFA